MRAGALAKLLLDTAGVHAPTVPTRSLRLFLLIVALCGASTASAQDPTRPLLGERAFGMAGAVTASDNGPTAAYYNPAGLSHGDRTALGASLSLNTFRRYSLAEAFPSVGGFEDLSDSGIDTSAVFLGGVLAFGPRDVTEQRQHALAAGTVARDETQRVFLELGPEGRADLASALEVTQRTNERWYYVAYGVRPDPMLSLGLTVALSVRDEEHRESIAEGANLMGTAGSLSARDVRIQLESMQLLARGGVVVRPQPWLELGLMVQSPGIPVSRTGRATFQRLTVAPDESSLFREELESIAADLPTPWELRVGGYARIAPVLGIGLDLGMIGPIASENDPSRPLDQPLPRDGARPASRYFAEDRWSDFGFDAALGVEVRVRPELPIRAGVLYQRSGNARITGPRDTRVNDSLDRVGGSLAVSFQGSGYDFTLGAHYAHGYGDALAPSRSPDGPAYLPTTASSHDVMVVLSGVTGAAAELALSAYDAITHDAGETPVEDPGPPVRPERTRAPRPGHLPDDPQELAEEAEEDRRALEQQQREQEQREQEAREREQPSLFP